MGGMIGEVNPIKHFGEWTAGGSTGVIFKMFLFPDFIRPSLMPLTSEIKGTEHNSHSFVFIE